MVDEETEKVLKKLGFKFVIRKNLSVVDIYKRNKFLKRKIMNQKELKNVVE